MELPYRIGNIELRKDTTLSIQEPKEYYEIVRYYPNGYYGKQSEFIFDEMRQMYHFKNIPNAFIDPECFKHKESCYVLSTLILRNDEEPDVKSVGSRPFNLDYKERDDYLNVVKYLYSHWEELYLETDND